MKGMNGRNGRKVKLLFAITALVVAMVLIYTATLLYKDYKISSGISKTPADVGFKAQDFKLKDVQGKRHGLDDMKGKAFLISFIDTQSAFSDKTSSNSRGEVNFLKSMYKQYSSKGLNVFVIDSSYLDTGRDADHDKLINFVFDWELKQMPLLIDNKSYRLADKYKVKTLPTTILINRDGVIDQRWDGFALSSQLALSIENLVGPPEYRIAESDNQTAKSTSNRGGLLPVQGDTPAMAKFPGLLPARMLSPEIWLVDGGKPWKGDGEYPVKWLVLNKDSDSVLEVIAENVDTGESKTLIEKKRMEQVPDQESKALLANLGNISTRLYLLDTPVKLDKPGKYTIKASVYKELNDVEPLYSGQAHITAN